jgi:hypothetical protein
MLFVKQVDGDDIVFRLPASVSAQQQRRAAAQTTQTTTETVGVEATNARFGLQVQASLSPTNHDQ